MITRIGQSRMRKRPHPQALSRCQLRCEPLESRQLMAADLEGQSAIVSTPPQVATIPVQIASVRLATGQSSPNAKTEKITPNNNKPLSVIFSSDEIREDGQGSVSLTARRDPRDVGNDLVIRVVGGNRNQLQIPSTITIPAGQSEVVIRVIPINDSIAEMPLKLNYTFSAAQHRAVAASIQLIDDEAPMFQNPASRFDVNDDGITSALECFGCVANHQLIVETERRGT